MSAYLLPIDKPVAIQFSGGRTSAYMLRMILDAHGGALPDNATVTFANTGREMPETLDFVQRCSQEWGVPVAWLEYRADGENFAVVDHNSASRDGEPFAALIKKRSYLPNPVTRFCTEELKIRTTNRYMISLGYERWWSVVGLRADEMRRVNRILDPKKKREREQVLCPLAAAGVSKRDVKAYWNASPFDLRLENANGVTPMGNCDGCFLKAESSRAHLVRFYPDRAAWWEEQERLVGATFRKDAPWSRLREHVDAQQDWVFDGDSDVYCDSPLGACETY